MGRVLALVVLASLLQICRAAAVSSDSDKAAALGISFIEGSTSSVAVERDGGRYVVDLVARTVRLAEQGAAAPGASAGQSKGAVVFARNCAACHGADGKEMRAFKTLDFTDPKTQGRLTDEQILTTIQNGKK